MLSITTKWASLGVVGLMLLPGSVLAHAALVSVAEVPGITISAYYETGEPMAGAQVVIYAPDAPSRPWATGTANAEGYFSFVPDERPGRWTVQARQAGHGAINHFTWQAGDVSSIMGATASTGDTSPLQRLIMVASVVWGCIGTALYFRRRPSNSGRA